MPSKPQSARRASWGGLCRAGRGDLLRVKWRADTIGMEGRTPMLEAMMVLVAVSVLLVFIWLVLDD